MRTLMILLVVVMVSAGWVLAQDSRPTVGTPHYWGSIQEILEWKASDFEDDEGDEEVKADDAGRDDDESEAPADDDDADDVDDEDEADDDDGYPELPPFLMKQSGKKRVSKKGIIRVDPGHHTRLVTHEVVALGQLEAGVPLWVLGRYQSPQPTGTGNTMPAQIIQIRAVVTTSNSVFEPPPLTEDAKKAKLSWQRGTLVSYGGTFRLASTNMQIGPKRKVVRVVPGDPEKLKRRARVIVTGSLDAQLDPPFLEASAIILPARGIPADDYVNVVGENR